MAETITATVDLTDPPIEPPANCSDPVVWRLAHLRYTEHRRTRSGECASCPRWRAGGEGPLARDGLLTAMGADVKHSTYWKSYAQLSVRGGRR